MDITGNITVEAWIKTSAGGSNGIAGKYNSIKGYILAVNDGKAQIRIYSDPNSWTSLASTSNINDSIWHHIVGVYDSSDSANELKIYVDGILNKQKSWNYPPTSNTADLIVGDYSGLAWHFNGTIDEVRVSNTVRDSNWINTSYINQNNPSSFYGISNEMPVGAPRVLNESPENGSLNVSISISKLSFNTVYGTKYITDKSE